MYVILSFLGTDELVGLQHAAYIKEKVQLYLKKQPSSVQTTNDISSFIQKVGKDLPLSLTLIYIYIYVLHSTTHYLIIVTHKLEFLFFLVLFLTLFLFVLSGEVLGSTTLTKGELVQLVNLRPISK